MSRRVRVLDPLRGIASFAVLWFHFAYANGFAARDSLSGRTAHYGWLGVEVFFVISGFVMPYAMTAKGYRLRRHWRPFLTKRILRLDPPYVASIVLVIALGYLAAKAPGYRGAPFHVTGTQLLLHLGYLNAFAPNARDAWLNPVYWTLAIEFQYYVLIALLYPVVMHRDLWERLSLYLLLGLAPFIEPNPNVVCLYLPLFGLGFATFQRYARKLRTRPWLALVAALTLVIAETLGVPQALAGAGTALVIGFAPGYDGGRVLKFLGMISYSLYLVHVPIGVRVVNLGARLGDSLVMRTLTQLAAIAVSIGAAYLLYRFVERRAIGWSDAISYDRGHGRRHGRSTAIATERLPAAP